MENNIGKYEQAINGAVKKISELNDKLHFYENGQEIAIIGYDCCFPGGADNPEKFWYLLSHGYDAVGEIGKDRFDTDLYYTEQTDNLAGKMSTKNAALLNSDIATFDQVHFEISEKEAVSIDPQHRLLLEVSWNAMINAGLDIANLKGTKVGVFIGAESFDYVNAELSSNEPKDITPYTLFGVMPTSASGRIAYFYDFRGPAVTCDTACSSSLVVLDMAMKSLRDGQCDMAMVGGVNLIMGPQPFVGLSQIHALAKDGRCKVFDESADGFGRGEGCGIILLKRMEDAIRDNNQVEAVVKGIAIGQDGKSNGFYAPNGIAEQEVMRTALKNSGLKPEEIDYVEAHGTGTSLGDVIETQSISEVYKDRKGRIWIGSVKSNIGHLDAGAGMASIIKVLLSMKHKQLPASIHFQNPNPNINWDKIRVVTEQTDWTKHEKRRAAISCYGISGTLAHVILEEPQEREKSEQVALPYHIVTLSTKRKTALVQAITDLKDYVNTCKETIEDIAYTSILTRSSLEHRYCAICKDKEELVKKLSEALENDENLKFHSGDVNKKKHKIAFLFTGQGSVYKEIGAQFYESSSEYREAFNTCNQLFLQYAGISVKDAVFQETADLTLPKYSQAVIFSIEYALTKLWNSVGIRADLVLGHSIGEYAAACCSGLISLEEAVKMIVVRVKTMEQIEPNGKMVGVLAEEETVTEAIRRSGCKNVSIAAVNTQKNITLSGFAEEVNKVIDELQKTNRVFVNDLGILHPYHSVAILPYTKEYGRRLEDIKFQNKQNVKMISSVTGDFVTAKEIARIEYWADHLAKKVNYYAAIQKASKEGIDIFIEIGGNATLTGLAQQSITASDNLYLPSLRKGLESYQQWFTSIESLYLSGYPVQLRQLYEEHTGKKVQLCNYPFLKKRFWKEIKKNKSVAEEEKTKAVGDLPSEEMEVMGKTMSDYELVEQDLLHTVNMLTGIDIQDIDVDKELVGFGFDSLLLASLGKQVEQKYGLVLSMDKLFTSMNTLSKIAQYITEYCDLSTIRPKKPDQKQKIEMKEVEEVPEQITATYELPLQQDTVYETSQMGVLKSLFDSQTNVIHEQNELLKKFFESGRVTKEPVQINLAAVKSPESRIEKSTRSVEKVYNANRNRNYYLPYKKMDVKDNSHLEDLQLKYLKTIEEKVTAMTKDSKNNTQKYRGVYASNRNSAGFRPLYKEMLYQIIAKSGHGSKLVDIDGNEYIDLTMGFGVNLFGHCPEFVQSAIEEELKLGMPLGPMGRLAGEVARQISELTGVERVFFCNSGTEADMFAIRVARAITGKSKIVCFTGGFHGTYDGTLGVPSFQNDPDQATLPMAPGITMNSVKDLILLDFDSDDSIQYIREHADVIAAVLTEPVQSRRPDMRPKKFLQKIRKVTKENQIAFILDEIISGFRIGAGGAQEYFDVEADIVTYGKVVGGGMPIGIVSGKAKYLDSIDGGQWKFGDDSVPPCDEKRTFVAGTFCHHPLAMASCDAVLKYITQNKDIIYPALNQKTKDFADRMNAFFNEMNVPVHINYFASLFRFAITKDKEIFFYGLLAKGIYIWEGRNCFFSTEHSKQDIEKVEHAIKETIYEMIDASYFGEITPDDPRGKKKLGISEKSGEVSIEMNTKTYGMSTIQQRLLSHILITETDPFDMVTAYQVLQPIDIKKVENTINQIIKRHEILRTALYVEEGDYKQKVYSNYELKIKTYVYEEEMDINEMIYRSLVHFDLSKPCLMEVLFIKHRTKGEFMVFHFHHTVADGISMNILVQEFAYLYRGDSLPKLELQYRGYVDYERKYAQSEQYQEDCEFFKNRLINTPTTPIMPYDHLRDITTAYQGDTLIKTINQDTLNNLKKLAAKQGCTLFMLLLSIVNVLIHKNTGETDVAVFSPTSTRIDGGFENNIGMFTNTVVLNNQVEAEDSFIELMKKVKDNLIASYPHFNYPYHQLIRDLKISGTQGFKTGFVYENIGRRDAKMMGLPLQEIEYTPSSQEEDITFELLESHGEIKVYFRYRSDLYTKASICLLAKRFFCIVQQVIENPTQPIKKINILTMKEREDVLYRFNDTTYPFDKSKTIVDLFEERVNKTPDKVAAIYQNESITYRKLNQRANQVATSLRALGAKPNEFVAIITKCSIETLVAVLGVVKSGAAYICIDEEFPKSRIEYMLNDSKPKAIVTYQVATDIDLPNIHLEEAAYQEGIDENPVHVNQSGDTLYCIYTSGTTGIPKGILISHRNVHADIHHYVNTFHINEDTISLQHGNYTFDLFTEETYPAYYAGATIVIMDKELLLNTEAAIDYMNKNLVNMVHTTPLLLNELNKLNQLQYVKTYNAGGDVLKPEYISNLLQSNAELFQDYGPTENTVVATVYQIKKSEEKMDYRSFDGRIPIGHPKRNTQVYIIREGCLCGIGIAGELCIGGEGLTKGYLNLPALNAEKFIDNPFGEGRLYRTGDLAKWLPDGNIEFIGRMDDQVKIRGQRIELGEIEHRIKELDGILDCAVIVRNDSDGEKAIYAYIVSGEKLQIPAIRASLRKNLPEYMIPTYMMQIDALPITRNGKIDKKKLPEVTLRGEGYELVPPRTDTEKVVCEVFGKILGIDQVGVYDSFFELGGHSLRATKLINLLEQKTGKRLTVKEVFQYQSVEKIAAFIDEKEEKQQELHLPKAKKKNYYAMSSTQKRIYLIWQLHKDNVSYNMPGVMRITGNVDYEKLMNALQQVINRNEILRTRFDMIDGELVQIIEDHVEADISMMEDEQLSIGKLMKVFVSPFDLNTAKLVRMRVIKREAEWLLLIDTHHIVSDGVSMQNFIREFCAIYNNEVLAPVEYQYKDYSEWMRKRDILVQKNFWVREYEQDIPVLDMPLDFARKKEQSYSGNTLLQYIDTALAENIRKLTEKTGTTKFMVLISAVMILISKYSRQEEIVIGTPISARTHADTENMMGMFVNTLAIHGKPEKTKRYIDFLQEIKEFCLKAYENQEYPFEELVEAINIKRDMSRNPLFDVMFALQNVENAEMQLSEIKIETLPYVSNIAKFDFTFDISEETDGRYKISLEYCSDLYTENTVERMLKHYILLLEQITQKTEAKLEDLDMVTNKEKKMICGEFNQTKAFYPKDSSIAELFEEQVRRTPKKTAVCYNQQTITYEELNRRANQLAYELRRMGVMPNDRIAIIAKRSLEVIVGVCGIVKSGGVYVPIDPSYPEERIRYILEDCTPKALFAYKSKIKTDLPIIDLEQPIKKEHPSEDLPIVNHSKDLAYIIYTSGTTGKPKGVMVSHKNVVKLVINADYTVLDENTVILQTGQLAFDASTFELWGAFLNGGELHLIDESLLLNAEQLGEYMRKNQINTMFLTTALFNQLLGSNVHIFDCLKHLLFGGEMTSERHVCRLRDHNQNLDFRNVYGPTETTTFATHYIIDQVRGKTPIGKPISNTTIYIMNESKLCGIGVPGEICICGDGVAEGYLNNPELTRERFVDNPFGEGRMYHSGDLGRWLEDGNIEYLGRMDEQVKIHGFRIELEEIENAIRALEGVTDCICIVKGENDDKALHVYVKVDGPIDFTNARSELSKTLPHYMIPAYWLALNEFPLNANGKINVKELPDIMMSSNQDYIEPKTQKEIALCHAIRNVLNLQRVGVMDNFFDLGGDSLKAMQIVTQLREFGYSVSVHNIMQYQVVKEIANAMHQTDDYIISEAGTVRGIVPFGAIQKIFLKAKVANPDYFCISSMFETKRRMSEQTLRKSIETVVSYHDMLKVKMIDGQQIILEDDKVSYDYQMFDLRSKETKEKIECEMQQCILKSQKSLSLSEGCLLAAALLRTKTKDFIYLCVHHLVADMISLRMIAEDIFTAYAFIDKGEIARLPRKTTSFQRWNHELQDLCETENWKQETEKWSKVVQKIASNSLVERNIASCKNTSLNKTYQIPGLGELASGVYQTSEDNIWMAAIAMVLCRNYHKDWIPIALEGHGRYSDIVGQLEVDRTVGWFTNVYPICVSASEDFEMVLSTIQKERENISCHGMGYLEYIQKQPYSSSMFPQVALNYLGETEAGYGISDDIRLSDFSYGDDTDTANRFLCSLSINITRAESDYQIHVVYDSNEWKKQMVQKLLQEAVILLKEQVNRTVNVRLLPATQEKDIISVIINEVHDKISQYDSEMMTSVVYTDYPLTGVQKISYLMGSRNAVIELQFFDKLDEEKFNRVWFEMLESYDVLRSSINLKNEEKYIRIYENKEIKIPMIDISMYSLEKKRILVDNLLNDLDCYYLDEYYTLDNLSSKTVLIKMTDTYYKLIFSSSHMIVDRFSADVFRNKIMHLYYQLDNQEEKKQYLYQTYYQLFCNEYSMAEEESIIEKLGLLEFVNAYTTLRTENKERDLETFIYRYENLEEWGKIQEEKASDLVEQIFLEAMRFVFHKVSIPILALHIARKNEKINLFDYIGEMLDVVPIILPAQGSFHMNDLIQERFQFMEQNCMYFSPLMFPENAKRYPRVSQMLKFIYDEMKQFIFIYNNTGILKEANDIIVNSDKYRLTYNVMATAIYQDGFFMNIPIEHGMKDELTKYLDEAIEKKLEEMK